MGRFVVGITVAIALCMMSVPQLLAGGRDSDASRMQARKIDVGTSESDSLSPPDDQIDWRYFKLDERKSVTVTVSGAAENATMKLELTTATGSKLDEVGTSRGTATLKVTLDPGIYYFSVSAKRSTSYDVTVK